jgi:hypothetical protein
MVVRTHDSRFPAQTHNPLRIVVLELAHSPTAAPDLAAQITTAVPAQTLTLDLSLDIRADLLGYTFYLFQTPRLIRQFPRKQLPKLPRKTLYHIILALVIVPHSHVSFHLLNYSGIRRQPPKVMPPKPKY